MPSQLLAPETADHYAACLPEHELARCCSAGPNQLRHARVTSRGFLRETLAMYLGGGPASLALARRSHGKPFLAGAPPHSLVRFNVSNTIDCIGAGALVWLLVWA